MKEIPLTQGEVALVDDEDYVYLSQFKWFVRKKKNENTCYAGRCVRINGRIKQVLMHREILNTPKGVLVDHKDHNGLNNQRDNIRNCDYGQNSSNRVTASKTGYLGVSYYDKKRKKTKPYRATIYHNGKNRHLGTFRTPEEAAIAYNNAASLYHGEFAHLNVIP